MATLNIDGQNVQVDDSFLKMSHDEQHATVDEIAASLKPQASPAMDVIQGAGSGLAKGVTGLAGMGGDVGSLIGSGVDYAGSKLGVAPDKVQQFKDMAKLALAPTPMGALARGPTSQDLQSELEKVTGPLYKPQTTLGQTAEKVGEFLPAVIGGPEGIGAKLLTRVAAPAIASETAGKLTEGTPAQPYAELAGALAGGAGATAAANKFKAMAAARNATNAIPGAEDLLKTAGNQFEAVKGSDAIIKPSSVEQMAKDIKTELLNEGYHPTSEGQTATFNALDRLEQMGSSSLKGEDDVANILHLLENPNALTPGGVTTKDMEVIRKNLVNEKMSTNPAAAGAARMASKSFMDKYSNLGQDDLLNGSNPFPTLKDAIANYAAGKRSNTVTGKIDLANLNAGTAGSGANIDNNMRQAIKQLARPINNTNVPVARRLGFNNPEIDAIKQAATGTTVGNAARYLGKGAPTGIVSAAGGLGVGHMAGGPIGAVAVPAAGYIAKKIGDLSTKRAVAAVDSLVRSRSPLAAQVAAQLPHIVNQLNPRTQALLTALVASDQTLREQLASPEGQQNTQ